jgi:hypothetical protein
MKRILLIALLAAFASATTMPTVGKLLGSDPTAAYAQFHRCFSQSGNDNSQGDEDCV